MEILSECLYNFGRIVEPVVFLGVNKERPEEVISRIQFLDKLLGVKVIATVKKNGTIESKCNCWFRYFSNPNLCKKLFKVYEGFASKLKGMSYHLVEKQTNGYKYCRFELRVK